MVVWPTELDHLVCGRPFCRDSVAIVVVLAVLPREHERGSHAASQPILGGLFSEVYCASSLKVSTCMSAVRD